MKVNDWVIHEDGRVGIISLLDFDKGRHLVMYDDTFARLTDAKYLTVVEKPVADILSAFKHNEEK